LHNPDVLILDEPTTGLDPNQLVEIRDLIKNIGKNKTVFLSTHIMQEVEAICDRIIIIDKGKIVTDKTLNNLVAEQTEQLIEVEFDKQVTEQLFDSLPNLKSVKNTHDLVWELTFSTALDMRSEVFDFAQNNGLKTLQIGLKNKNLEQIFREKTAKK
jgi:ABC-2 type transport system ATP-binding protein